MANLQIINFPISWAEHWQQHTGDPIQNALAPYIMQAQGVLYNTPFQFEYVPVEHAYRLIKLALEGKFPGGPAPAEADGGEK